MGEQEQRGSLGQSKSRNAIPSTVKHGEGRCVGVDLDSLSD